LILAIWQLSEARQERIKAKDALEKAQQATNELAITEMRLQTLEEDITNEVANLRVAQAQRLSGDKSINVMFLRNAKNKTLLPLSGLLLGRRSNYGRGYSDHLLWHQSLALGRVNGVSLSKGGTETAAKLLREDPNKYYDSLLEASFISWMHREYSLHWIRTMDVGSPSLGHSSGAYGWVSLVDSGPDRPYLGADVELKKDVAKWEVEDIRAAFPSNFVVAHMPVSGHSWGDIALPPDATVEVRSPPVYSSGSPATEIKITTPRVTLVVLLWVGQSGGPSYYSEKRMQELYPDTDYDGILTSVLFSWQFNPEQVNTRLASLEHQWIERLVRRFGDDFEWSRINPLFAGK